ncbi:MAG: STAS domain-containing protein [Eubacteriales bacterium]|nr:STAS domain-containing protein [Eubacteriales bacterium]
MLHITQTERDGALTISLAGELDHHAARAAIEQAEDLLVLYPCQRLALDLSGLTFMDSSGLAVVLHLHRTCARAGYDFVVRGTPPQPMRVFEAAGLPQVMIFERGE